MLGEDTDTEEVTSGDEAGQERRETAEAVDCC